MITPQLKDKILCELTEHGTSVNFKLNEVAKEFSVTSDILDAILSQFEKMDLLSLERMLGGAIYAHITADAFDFIRLGGFTAKEEFMKLNLQKLQMEVDELKKTAPETAERITAILANIASVASIFYR